MTRAVRSSRKGRPFILGLTGSIGMGKSAVATMLRAQNIPVFDADAEVHRLQGPDGAILADIEAAFPGSTGVNGVDRQKLGAQVFGDAAALKRLEAIVHPAVARVRQDFLKRHRSRQIIVLDIPLLFEKSAQSPLNAVLVVSAARWQQRQRVMARPMMTMAKFRHIQKLQTPDIIKRSLADYVINTGTTLMQTRRDVRLLVHNLRAALA